MPLLEKKIYTIEAIYALQKVREQNLLMVRLLYGSAQQKASGYFGGIICGY